MTKYLISGMLFILILLVCLFSWFWNKVKDSSKFLALRSKIQFCCLKSQEKVHLCLGKGQRREAKGGRISEESQRKSSRGPGFLHKANREPHCRWGLLLSHLEAAVSYTPTPGFRLPNAGRVDMAAFVIPGSAWP